MQKLICDYQFSYSQPCHSFPHNVFGMHLVLLQKQVTILVSYILRFLFDLIFTIENYQNTSVHAS